MMILAHVALLWLCLLAVVISGELRFDLHLGKLHIVLSASYYPMLQLQFVWYLKRGRHLHLDLHAFVGLGFSAFYGQRLGGRKTWFVAEMTERIYGPRIREIQTATVVESIAELADKATQ